ncbi:hypothetical protein KEM56_004411, partial [Ascosphaera pollenicola]
MQLATTLLLLTSMVFPHTAQAASYELEGCYKKGDGLTSKGSYQWQSAGYCVKECKSYAVMAMKAGSECYCADELPPSSDKTDDSDCDTGCNGFPDDDCGGDDVYSFYYTGNKKPKVQSDTSTSTTAASSTTQASTTTTSAPSKTTSLILTTSGGHTVYVTPTTAPDTEGSSDKKSGGTNKAAIAAGVVVGVVGTAAIIAAIIFWLKRRNSAKVKDEYRRNAQLSDYVAGGAAAGNGREKYGHDQRLDPSAQRRLSNG